MRIRHNNLLALVMTLLGVAIMLPLFSIVAEAVNAKLSLSDADDESGVESYISDVNEELEGMTLHYKDGSEVKGFYLFDGDAARDDITLEIRKDRSYDDYGEPIPGYNELDTESKSKVIEVAFAYLEDSGLSRTTKVKIYNFIYRTDESVASNIRQLSSDIQADFYSGYAWFKDLGLPQIISKVIGLVVIVIFALLGVTLALDLAYINLPFFQLFLDDNEANNGRLKARLISYEARKAVKEGFSKDDGSLKDLPMMCYLKCKTKQLAVLFICILYLVSGQIYNVLARYMDLFLGVLGVD